MSATTGMPSDGGPLPSPTYNHNKSVDQDKQGILKTGKNKEKGLLLKQRIRQKFGSISFPTFSFTTPSFIKRISGAFAKARISRSPGEGATPQERAVNATAASVLFPRVDVNTVPENRVIPTTGAPSPSVAAIEGNKAEGPQGIYISAHINLSDMIHEFLEQNKDHPLAYLLLEGITTEEINNSPEEIIIKIANNLEDFPMGINSLKFSKPIFEKIAPELTGVIYDHNSGSQWPVDQFNDFFKNCKGEHIKKINVIHPNITCLPFDALPACRFFSVYNCKNLQKLPSLPGFTKKDTLVYNGCPNLDLQNLPKRK